MSITIGQDALGAHLQGMTTTASIGYLDGPTAPLPRYVIQHPAPNVEPLDLAGTADAHVFMAVNVETATGDYGQTSKAMIRDLEARFRFGTTIEHDGRTIIIDSIPSPRGPMFDGGVMTVPVMIRGWFSY